MAVESVVLFSKTFLYSILPFVEFDGIFLSNGPGDPSMCEVTVKHIQKALTTKKPLFGICLGHQLLSRAVGCHTYKLKLVLLYSLPFIVSTLV